ncbi:MAG: hypothetical protein WKF31_05725 [Thermoleophilaceae bacterium]
MRGSAWPCARPGGELREVLVLLLDRVHQGVGRPEQRRDVEAGEHRGVADRLHEPDGGLGDARGELAEAAGQAAEVVGRDPLPEAGEALEVGEGDGHLARAREPAGLPLGAAHDALAHLLAHVDPQKPLHEGAGLRHQLGGGLREALGQVALRITRLDQHLARRAGTPPGRCWPSRHRSPA